MGEKKKKKKTRKITSRWQAYEMSLYFPILRNCFGMQESANEDNTDSHILWKE